MPVSRVHPSYVQFPRFSVVLQMDRMLKDLLIRHFQATGTTLLEVIHSVSTELSPETKRALKKIAFFRNTTLHTEAAPLTWEDIEAFEQDSAMVQAGLAAKGIPFEDLEFLDWKKTPPFLLDTSNVKDTYFQIALGEDPLFTLVGKILSIEHLFTVVYADALARAGGSQQSLAKNVHLLQNELPVALVRDLKWVSHFRTQLFYEDRHKVSEFEVAKLSEIEDAVTKQLGQTVTEALQKSTQDAVDTIARMEQRIAETAQLLAARKP